MRLLDLFCGAGGAGMGYYLAGFEVVGVDIKPQPRYPFEFHQADALEFAEEYGQEFDIVHASPPCQFASWQTPDFAKKRHENLITPVQELFDKLKKPYIIENVPGARRFLRVPVLLCGSMFGLRVFRHRYFETSPHIGLTLTCHHHYTPILVTGTPRRKGVPRKDATIAQKRDAMNIDWMVTSEIDQAIPPAYTEFLGKQIRRILNNQG